MKKDLGLRVAGLLAAGLFLLGWQLPLWAKAAASDAEIAQKLGWVESSENHCGGYYLEAPFRSAEDRNKTEKLRITSDQYNITQHGVSTLQGKVSISYGPRQLLANKAYLYRDPITGKLNRVDLSEALHLREPNTLMLAEKGKFDLRTKANSLSDLTYRTVIYGNLANTFNTLQHLQKPSLEALEALEKPRKVEHLSAWGEAKEYSQTQAKVYHFEEASYSTCPPTHSLWRVKASELNLDKESGRGTAKNARLLLKGVPVFYLPYLNFPIDSRRKSGFLWPTVGSLNRNNSYSGYYLGLPFYWNLAPNYDTTITPTYYSARGLQVADLFRYLTPISEGKLQVSILPNDQNFPVFKEKQTLTYQSSTDSFKQAELNRLLSTNDTRSSLSFQHESRFNEHWNGNVDYNYVSDDYFLEDFSKNLTENAQNQLPQQGELNYADEHWNFTGRLQSYQTLHPIDIDSNFKNQYSRLPQLLLGGDYPDQKGGMDYFINTEATYFSFVTTPGDDSFKSPIGERVHAQPGLALPLNWPYLYVRPRAQVALTEYELRHVDNFTPKHQDRGLPIFDLSTGLFLDQNIELFHQPFHQTLEPQAYYVYIPYRNQAQIPIFDTTVNTLSYDQLFVYNRFSSIDRINDADHLSLGVTTRLLDPDVGTEYLRAAIGEIIYFKNRSVTLCQSADVCTDYPDNNDNKRRLSPVSAILNFNFSSVWNGSANAIWNPQTKELDNETITVQYKRDRERVINFSFSYARNGDPFAGIILNSNASVPGINNENFLKLTDISASWPIFEDWGVVGRWSEDWNTLHFQNLLYGLQYDGCCWAAQFVAGRTFTGIQQNRPQYSNQFYFQITLKGLGSFNAKGDPTAALKNNISGYQSRFGQDI